MIEAIVLLRRPVAVLLVTIGAVTVQVGRTDAQQPPAIAAVSNLDDRLDLQTRRAVQQIVDSAAANGLPAAPLVDKALEGAAKHAPGQRIVEAVRMLAADLGVARSALGAVDAAALGSAVGALRVGVAPAQLRELHDARHEAGLVWPLTVLADLVTRGVPTDTAAGVILSLARAGASDAVFSRFAADVLRDIGAGVPPGAAAIARAGIEVRPAGAGPATRPVAAPPRGAPAPRVPARPAPPPHRSGR